MGKGIGFRISDQLSAMKRGLRDGVLVDEKRLYLVKLRRASETSGARYKEFVVGKAASTTLARSGMAIRRSSKVKTERRFVRPESFVLHVNRLDGKGNRTAAMDLLYDRIDELMRKGEFDRLNTILTRVPVPSLTVDVLLGLLTATLPAKGRLPGRKEMFEKIDRELRDRGDYEEGLLTGLE